MKYNYWKCLGPISLSALSLFIGFLILQPLACSLDATFNLLSNRGIGKAAFISMVIYQLILFFSIQPYQFLKNFLQNNVTFIVKKYWFKNFCLYFFIFSLLHSLILIFIYFTNNAYYNQQWLIIKNYNSLAITLSLSLIGPFLVAWTEELIFRGTLYPYFEQYYKPIYSMFIISTLFMFAHNLTNPLKLVTTEWKLGLGLFLLGILLNLIYIITGKLYSGMGAHAGLVFVKAILRRFPIILFIPEQQWVWWINKDLRQSFLIHLLFLITNIVLIIQYKNKLFSSPNSLLLNKK